MGKLFTDNFSILHLAVGVIFYFWGISLTNSIIIHVIFEYLENLEFIMKINNSTGWWPGGKPSSDNFINNVGDTFYFAIGWLIAKYIDGHYDSDAQLRGKF
jgi:hypothetical protein